MFDKCVLFNLHASKPVWAGCVSSLYYIRAYTKYILV